MKEIFDLRISNFDFGSKGRFVAALAIANPKSEIENITVALLKHGRGFVPRPWDSKRSPNPDVVGNHDVRAGAGYPSGGNCRPVSGWC